MTVELSGGLFEALLNSLILGALFLVGIELLFRVAPRTSAATRYLCWWMALLAVVVLPLFASTSGGEHGPPSILARNQTTSTESRSALVEPLDTAPSYLGFPRLSIEVPANLALALGGLWLLGSTAAFLRLLWAGLAVRRMRATASPPDARLVEIFELARVGLGARRPVQIAVSDAVAAPTLLGGFRPLILIPPSLVQTGAHDGLDWIAAHELAHLRRWDDWTQLGQRILLCLVFFHPLALWISRRLDLERELACDQMASASVGLSAGAYASGLVRFSRSLVMARHWAALSMASRLAERVEALSVRPPISRPRVSLRAPIFVLLLCTAAAIAASRPLLAVSVRSAGDAGRGQAITEVEELVQRLRSRDPRIRAIAAYRLGQLRAEPAIPALLPLVADPTELPREPGSMSQPWGRPEERAEGTSVGEEAVKALLFIGQAALRPLEDELSRSAETSNPFARWAVDLLADFD